MLDAKRRQGFLSTLVQFHSSYDGIQKKHAILNSNRGRDKAGRARTGTKFPLLLSSGSRQDYTRGADEGTLALRAPQDVDFFLRHFSAGGAEGYKGGNHIADAIDGVVSVGATPGGEGGGRRVEVASAAERALARARDRAAGVVAVASPPHRRGSKRLRWPGGGWGTRSYVVGVAGGRSGGEDAAAGRDGDDGDEDEDEDGDLSPHTAGAASLIDWLSSSRDRTARGETEVKVAAISASSTPSRLLLESEIKHDDAAADKPSSPSTDKRIQIGDGDNVGIDPNNDSDENDDLEDGYIAI
jgi:hypothetical protein